MDLRPVLYVNGILMVVMALGMIPPMLFDLYKDHEDWLVFFSCIIVTLFFGGALIISNSGKSFSMDRRQAFLLIFTSWITVSIFGALPFYISNLELSFTDSMFESISGVTTTGATIMTNLREAPPGILLWRGILQWFGGIGIILITMSLLPFLKLGGMQIFQTELSENEKATPRIASFANSIGLTYVIITVLCAICYSFAGMGYFDAAVHAMTTVATGGFSTFDTSFSHYESPGIESIAIFFMILGGLPFILYLKMVKGDWGALLRDSQALLFLFVILGLVTLLVSYLVMFEGFFLLEALRRVSFTVVSIITGTGYSNSSYDMWGAFPLSLFLFLMVVGGCAGSTSCGIKIFRFQVLFSIVASQIKSILNPRGVFIPYYNGAPLPRDVPVSVMSFFFLYGLAFALLAMALSMTGLDFITALSGAATSISNVGPGLGPTIGPDGTFQTLSDSAKWILSVGMILGRLELFTALVLLAPQFWRQ